MSTPASTYRRVLRRDPCSYCGEPVADIDHIIPGGGNEWSNLTGACQRCNRSKSDVPLLFALLGITAPTFRAWPDSPTFPRRNAPAQGQRDSLERLRIAQRLCESSLLALEAASLAREDMIRAYHADGWTIREIAAEIGTSFQLVGRIVKRQSPKPPAARIGLPRGRTTH